MPSLAPSGVTTATPSSALASAPCPTPSSILSSTPSGQPTTTSSLRLPRCSVIQHELEDRILQPCRLRRRVLCRRLDRPQGSAPSADPSSSSNSSPSSKARLQRPDRVLLLSNAPTRYIVCSSGAKRSPRKCSIIRHLAKKAWEDASSSVCTAESIPLAKRCRYATRPTEPSPCPVLGCRPEGPYRPIGTCPRHVAHGFAYHTAGLSRSHCPLRRGTLRTLQDIPFTQTPRRFIRQCQHIAYMQRRRRLSHSRFLNAGHQFTCPARAGRMDPICPCVVCGVDTMTKPDRTVRIQKG